MFINTGETFVFQDGVRCFLLPAAIVETMMLETWIHDCAILEAFAFHNPNALLEPKTRR
jgi:hypothetical protein